jgi:predicted MFS family arabinose efflux permease
LIGLAVGIYGLTQAIFQIPFSLWADRVPRKPLIIFGLLLFALGGVIAATSTSIWGVILGRALAGSGAISAVVMALLADVTREEQRTKAMAMMGMSIGLSFVVAFSAGPSMTAYLGISGLFWLTAILGILAMLLLLAVPNPEVQHKYKHNNSAEKVKLVLKNPNLNRLHISIFMLHLLMTALFVFIPSQLIEWAGLSISQHGWVYLPLLLIGCFFAIPAIIVAEKKQQMRNIFMSAVLTVFVGLVVLAIFHTYSWGLVAGLALFFIAFNVIEALLPSWLSKIAPPSVKATAMGINASSQFLGAFFGGVIGGQLLAFHHLTAGWIFLAVIAGIWVVVSWFLQSPRYLSTITVKLPNNTDTQSWSYDVLSMSGVEEVVVLKEQGIAYIKIDQQAIDDESRQHLSQWAV